MKALIILSILFCFSCKKEIEPIVVENNNFESFERNNIYGSYKNYVALISQTGTSNPTVKILENTLGNIVWSRNGIGEYSGTLIGAFTTDKTWGVSNQYANNNISLYYGNQDVIILDILEGDNLISDLSIEIRVYY
jgi:hypothetical protein